MFTIVSAHYDVLEKQKCMFIFCDHSNPNVDSGWEARRQSPFGGVAIGCGCSRFSERVWEEIGMYEEHRVLIWIDSNQIVKAIEARFRKVHLLFQRSHSY